MADSQRVNDSGADFLRTDLETALTYVNIARTSTNPQTVERNYRHAREAYDLVSRLLPQIKSAAPQRQTIEQKLAQLRARLEAAGQQF